MSYQEQLNPWVIYQLLPNLQRQTLSRFRRRNDAEGYLKVLKQMRPSYQYELSFETNSLRSGVSGKESTPTASV